jgi:hypothetical protein
LHRPHYGSGFRVDFRSKLVSAILDDVRRGTRIDCDATLPAFVVAPNCPLSVAREFLAGLFGGDGWAPQLVNDGGRRRKANVLGAGGSRLRSVKLMHRCRSEHRAATQTYFENVRSLLLRVGVVSDIVADAALAARGVGNGDIEVRLAVASDAEFADKVGIRYCRQKQHRVEVAASFYRYTALIVEQRREIVELAIASRIASGTVAKAAIRSAVATLQAQGKHVRDEAVPADEIVTRWAARVHAASRLRSIGMRRRSSTSSRSTRSSSSMSLTSVTNVAELGDVCAAARGGARGGALRGV